jgi:hypothetical protein
MKKKTLIIDGMRVVIEEIDHGDHKHLEIKAGGGEKLDLCCWGLDPARFSYEFFTEEAMLEMATQYNMFQKLMGDETLH